MGPGAPSGTHIGPQNQQKSQKYINPTSPLGWGGLVQRGVLVSNLSPLPSGRGLRLPLALHWIIPPLSRDEREEKVVVVCVCVCVLGCVMDSRKN